MLLDHICGDRGLASYRQAVETKKNDSEVGTTLPDHVPVVSESLDDGALDAFIADEVQAALSATG